MQQIYPETSILTFDSVYEKYSPMLYAIAIEISSTEDQAEQILITTFQKFHILKVYHQDPACLCASLIKLIIHTAHEHLNGQLKSNFKLKQFENAPLLHRLLCENVTVEKFCEENKLTKLEVAKKLREEFTSLRR